MGLSVISELEPASLAEGKFIQMALTLAKSFVPASKNRLLAFFLSPGPTGFAHDKQCHGFAPLANFTLNCNWF
jgi:hypothetical protein